LFGPIPPFDTLSNLIYLNLIDNNLIGSVPTNIGSKIATKAIFLGQSKDGNFSLDLFPKTIATIKI
jgi:hypothetical protein